MEQNSELPKAYDHTQVETKIYEAWQKTGYFNPDKLPERHVEPYVITMPPPNANAPMHLGHALFVTIEDIIIRYQRMQGKKALWQPGTDHAGFETQVVFEKKLDKEGRSRFKMQREEFYKECWDFVQSNKHITENGLKRLGASCDWDRNIFTLDPEIIKVVYQTFAQMHKDGLIYRGERLGNWCSKHQTALSDLETKYEERIEPFYYLKYGPFVIGTSRPETKFGDKYVVMHPDDARYAKYKHGEKIDLEWINGPITATIIKDSAVDMEFGTGVMTITPSHDPVDFEIAERLDLEKEQIIDMRGKLLPIAGEFSGMKILEARPKIIEKLAGKGLVDHVDDKYKHNVQMCYKCNTLIEPQIIPQWYVAMTKTLPDGRPALRDMAVNAIKNGEVKIVTEKFEKIFMHWMENLRDWPISRQIWWGIPIPVKYCTDCKEVLVDTEDKIQSCPKCSSQNLVRDPDTFDTWFSSGQWPYATLMANDAKRGTKDMEKYFPTQVMETGWDILFFWVARMVMFSYYKTGKPPFENVYLHGLVRDKDRQKMSKSKGNVIDPLGVIDTYGTDALRFALVFSTAAGNDIPLAEDKIKGMKHFANKLWNIARFIMTNVSESDYTFEAQTDADKAILEALEKTVQNATKNLDSFMLHEAAQEIYQFTWRELADVYLEKSKEQLKDEKLKANTEKILLHQLVWTLKLLHPFMPFITEHIWQILREKSLVKTDWLMVADWPKS
ncbi:MAG: valine--tRNA ligase [Patescibacteria group bacterium]|nr:valine--tRNA ligase [Patescibacteria group bacterium]